MYQSIHRKTNINFLNQDHEILSYYYSLIYFEGGYSTNALRNSDERCFNTYEHSKKTEALHAFEQIAKTTPNEWLPLYYASQIQIISSFGVKDKILLSERLEEAQELLNKAEAISKDNPELMVLQALLHTAWIAFDGATYGRFLSEPVETLYEKAVFIAPHNPRVVYNRVRWKMGKARYFGKDTAPFCKTLEHALELFATFKPETPLHPNWGENRTKKALASCRKS